MSRKAPHCIFRKLLEIMDSLRSESIRTSKESDHTRLSGLTTRQGAVISQLKLMLENQPEGVSLKDLARRIHMTIPAASQLVETLVLKNYVQRNPDPTDRRAVRITLSETGLNIFEEVYAHFDAELDIRAQALTNEEMGALERIVKKIQK